MNLDTVLRGREFFSAMDLVRVGLFPHRSSVWKKVKAGKLQVIATSKQSRVVTRESVIRYLKELNKEKE
jgi:hypothetical protein